MDLPARLLHRLFKLDQIAVQIAQRMFLQRPSGLPQFLPVRHLGDHVGALGADGLGGVADVAPELGIRNGAPCQFRKCVPFSGARHG